MRDRPYGPAQWIVPPVWTGTSLENWDGALTAQGFDSSTLRMGNKKCEVLFCGEEAHAQFSQDGKTMWVCKKHLAKKLDAVHKRNRRS